MICVISLNQEELSRETFATLFCFAQAGYWMDFDPLLICYVFYLGEKEQKTKYREKIIGGIRALCCVSRLNYCVAGGAVGSWSLGAFVVMFLLVVICAGCFDMTFIVLGVGAKYPRPFKIFMGF